MSTFYYSKKDIIQFKTELNSDKPTSDKAYTGINKYILYNDPQLTTVVGQILYTATVYHTNSVAYNPYVLTLFFNDGKNLTSTGAHNDSPTTFFPIGTPERSTVTDLTGITGIKYVEVTRLDENLRKIKLKKSGCGC
jgi:hypothetical protein